MRHEIQGKQDAVAGEDRSVSQMGPVAAGGPSNI